jgi:uncharacterized damage-inducible protein DinB
MKRIRTHLFIGSKIRSSNRTQIYLKIKSFKEDVPQGRKLGESESFVGRDLSEQELRRLTRRVDRFVNKIMDSLKPRDLGRTYVVQGEVNGKPYTMTICLADIVWHMVEEQLQHIGELNALFWQMDIDPPTHAWFSSKLSFTF